MDRRRVRALLIGALGIIASSARALAGDAAVAGRLIEERPTLKCLGVRWYVSGDADGDARVEVRVRRQGEHEWRRCLDLFRTRSKWQPRFAPQKGETLFAGSVFDLEEDATYEVKLNLVDPDGGAAEQVLKMRTRAEPALRRAARVLHVVPGSGGGSGSTRNPFKGLAAAERASRPGDLMLVHRGVYAATWEVRRSGEEGRPIVWRAAGDGEAIIDGGEARPQRGIAASGLHDVWFEGLVVRNVRWGIVAHEAERLVVRRCRTYDTEYGFTATRHSAKKPCLDLFIADNDMTGPTTWPRTKGIENARGVQVTGSGHVVCHNRIRGFADAIDTFRSEETSAVDIYANDVSVMTDDGIETDYSDVNVRCFRNRLTNVFQGISTQPVHGGPVYVFRNVMVNVGYEPFKMHNSPSGALFFHNTSVATGMPLLLMTSAPVDNCVTRNNIFIGAGGNYAYENTARMTDCDFDLDGFGGTWKLFLKWNDVRYATVGEVRAKAPVYRNVIELDPARTFRGGDARAPDPRRELVPGGADLRLSPRSRAVDRGARLPNVNDGFRGRAPDLGAYELGEDPPHYGPRPVK
ncbi:MAG: hypothetical protein ACYS9X_14690 [Planctomycetota bacterium]|jgi:hypothetical protein